MITRKLAAIGPAGCANCLGCMVTLVGAALMFGVLVFLLTC